MDHAEVERALEDIDNRMERLRALYEQYFLGIERLEPLVPRKDLERRPALLRREQIRNTALRFKFQTLVQRYNSYQQYWNRVARDIDNGTYHRDVLRAAARFGAKDALTILGKRQAQKYARLAESQEARLAQTPRETALLLVDPTQVDAVNAIYGSERWNTVTFLRRPEVPGFWPDNGLVATVSIMAFMRYSGRQFPGWRPASGRARRIARRGAASSHRPPYRVSGWRARPPARDGI